MRAWQLITGMALAGGRLAACAADGVTVSFVAPEAETMVTQMMPDGAREAVASVLGVTWASDR